MIQDIFIGVDGGGTKSVIRVENAHGDVLGQSISGPANIRISVNQAWQSIYSGLEHILTPLNIALTDSSYRFNAAMGLAGSEYPLAHQAYINIPHPFAQLNLVSDAHIACLAAHEGRDGAIIIIGTGVVGYQIYGEKKMKVSGWGFPHDDPGSGAWMGFEVIQILLRALDHRIDEHSGLLEAIYKRFNQNMDELLMWLQTATSTQFAQLAPLVIEYANKKDPWARHIIKSAALEIEQIGRTLEKTAPGIPCALVGGLAEFIEPHLTHLRSRLIRSAADPCVGAIRVAREGV